MSLMAGLDEGGRLLQQHDLEDSVDWLHGSIRGRAPSLRPLRLGAAALCAIGLLGAGLRLAWRSGRGVGQVDPAAFGEGVVLAGTQCTWTRYKGCLIPGFNIALYQDESITSCLELCEDHKGCKSVEYATDREDGGDVFKPGVCILQSVDRGAKDYSKVVGYKNVDLYIKDCSARLEWVKVESNHQPDPVRGSLATKPAHKKRVTTSPATTSTTALSTTARKTTLRSTTIKSTTVRTTTIRSTTSTTKRTTTATDTHTTTSTTRTTTSITRTTSTTVCIPPRKTMQPSLFGFSVMTPGPEVALLKSQFAKKTSIFGCNDYAVISVQKISFGVDECGKEVWTWCNPYLRSVGIGQLGPDTTNSWLNTGTFINAWDMLMKSGAIWSHAWITKVDPDAVMLPDRLRNHVAPYTGAPHYVINCNWGGKNKIFGAVEVFSIPAIAEYKNRPDVCKKDMKWHGWGEDMYMQKCMDKLGVPYVTDFNLVGDARCSFKPCEDQSAAAYHPFKDVASYWSCWDKSQGR